MSRELKKVREGARHLSIQEKSSPSRTAGVNGLRHRTARPTWKEENRQQTSERLVEGGGGAGYVTEIFWL